MELKCSSKTSLSFYQTTPCHVPEYRNLKSQDLYKRMCLNKELYNMQTEKQIHHIASLTLVSELLTWLLNLLYIELSFIESLWSWHQQIVSNALSCVLLRHCCLVDIAELSQHLYPCNVDSSVAKSSMQRRYQGTQFSLPSIQTMHLPHSCALQRCRYLYTRSRSLCS